MRDEADRLVKEALQRNVVVKEGKTHIAAKCRKCGAPNRISAARGEARVAFTCEWCKEKQATL
jgi:RNase P subunit RPR2